MDWDVIEDASNRAKNVALARVTSVDVIPVSQNMPWIAKYSWRAEFEVGKSLRGRVPKAQVSFSQNPDYFLCGTYFEVPQVGDFWVIFLAEDGSKSAFPAKSVASVDIELRKVLPPAD